MNRLAKNDISPFFEVFFSGSALTLSSGSPVYLLADEKSMSMFD
jgi:hypothetical protein